MHPSTEGGGSARWCASSCTQVQAPPREAGAAKAPRTSRADRQEASRSRMRGRPGGEGASPLHPVTSQRVIACGPATTRKKTLKANSLEELRQPLEALSVA